MGLWSGIFDNFSLVDIRSIKKLARLSDRIESFRWQIYFLKKCREFNIFPRSCIINFKMNKKLFKNKNLVMDLQMYILKSFLKEKFVEMYKCIYDFKRNRLSLDKRSNFNYSILNSFMSQFRHNRSAFYCNKYESKFKWIFSKFNRVYFSDRENKSDGPIFGVVNLSGIKLNDRELEILSKGPNFVPFHSKTIVFDTISSIESSDLSDRQKVGIQMVLNKSLHKKEKFIINPAEVRHLRNKLIANDVIISHEDKAGRFVIMKGDEFREKMDKELNNGKYMLLEKNPGNGIKKKLIDIMRKMVNLKIFNRVDYLKCYPNDFISAKVFVNVKTHKDGFPLRFIFDFTGSVVEGISRFLNNFLKQFVNFGHFTVSSSFEAFDKINNFKMESNWVFGSLDIENMYQSVNRLSSIDVLISVLVKQGSLSKNKIKIIKDLFLLLEDSMYFIYDGNFYKIKEGWIIGYIISPLVCSVYINYLEEEIIIKKNCLYLKLFVRYVDDCFFVVEYDKLKVLVNEFNCFDPSIRYVVEGGGLDFVKLKFLDLLVIRNVESNCLVCSHFVKSRELRSIIKPDSYQAVSHKVNALKGYCYRNKKLNNSGGVALFQKSQFYKDYLKIGYSDKFVKSILFNSNIFKNKNIKDKEKYDFISLPFKLSSYKIICKKASLFGNKKIAWKRGITLNNLLNNTKEIIDRKTIPGVVYFVPCFCMKIYIGQSSLSLNERIKVHKSRVKNRYLSSALYVHEKDTGHKINFDEANVVFFERNEMKRRVKESLLLKIYFSEAINLFKSSFNIKGEWDMNGIMGIV